MAEKDVDPIRNPEKLGDKLLKIIKMIFRRPKHEEYFVKPYIVNPNISNMETWNKCSEAIMKAGVSFEQANTALINFSRVLPKEELEYYRKESNNGG